MSRDVLQVRGLRTSFHSEEGTVQAVNDVSFSIQEGETVCIVGESGCGKSAAAMSIMRLIDEQAGHTVEGEILFNERDILRLKRKEISRLRGNDISMIFQEPGASLNPVLTIGEQIAEPLMEHELLTRKEAKTRAVSLIERVGIGRAEEIYKSYPHQLSGGMLQRIMIAIALSCNPKLLIADEPTTALDVTIQAQILDLLRKLKEEKNMAMLLITHDLGVVAEVADRVIIMYAGKIIENAPVKELFLDPKHPYTKGLLKAKPVINQQLKRLYSIPGSVPSMIGLPDACHFSERCESCIAICREKAPGFVPIQEDHHVACWLYKEGVGV